MQNRTVLSNMPTVLVLGEHRGQRHAMAAFLGQSGYRVAFARDAREGERLMAHSRPAIILIEWALPDRQGMDVMRRLRRDERLRATPVIFVSSRHGEDERVAALDAGADDFMAAPAHLPELLARITAVLRRRAPHLSRDPVRVGPLWLDPLFGDASVDGRRLHLSEREFQLVFFLAAYRGTVFSRSMILDQVWGDHCAVEDRCVDVYVRRIRIALTPSGHQGMLETVIGAGYRLRAENRPAKPRYERDRALTTA